MKQLALWNLRAGTLLLLAAISVPVSAPANARGSLCEVVQSKKKTNGPRGIVRGGRMPLPNQRR